MIKILPLLSTYYVYFFIPIFNAKVLRDAKEFLLFFVMSENLWHTIFFF